MAVHKEEGFSVDEKYRRVTCRVLTSFDIDKVDKGCMRVQHVFKVGYSCVNGWRRVLWFQVGKPYQVRKSQNPL